MVAFEITDMLDETTNRSLLPLRKAIIEPVFGQIKIQSRFCEIPQTRAQRSSFRVEADLHDPQPAEVLAN
jgi:hypothetical protein